MRNLTLVGIGITLFLCVNHTYAMPPNDLIGYTSMNSAFGKLNLTTGYVTPGSCPPGFWDLDFAPDGTLYGLSRSADALYRITNPETGQVEMLTSLPRDSGGDPIAVSPDGNYIYFILNRGHASGPLYKYNLNAGQMIALGEVQAPKAFSGMQFTSDGTLYAIDGKNYGTKRLWTLDLNSLEATPVGPELFGINEMEAGGMADALELGPDCIMYLLITPEAYSWPSNPHPTEYVGTIDLSTGLATINWNAPISGFDHCDTMALPPGSPCILVVSIDIKPASCFNPLNLRSNGILPVAVLGMEDFDVNDIDIASIRLAGVAPFRSSYQDITGPESDDPNACGCATTCPDGYTDLMLKFRTPELAEALTDIYGEIIRGDELELTLTGALYDGTPIEGLDYITVVGKVPNRLNKPNLNKMKKTK